MHQSQIVWQDSDCINDDDDDDYDSDSDNDDDDDNNDNNDNNNNDDDSSLLKWEVCPTSLDMIGNTTRAMVTQPSRPTDQTWRCLNL